MRRFYFSRRGDPAGHVGGKLVVSGVIEGEDLDSAMKRLDVYLWSKAMPGRSRDFEWSDLAALTPPDHGVLVATAMCGSA